MFANWTPGRDNVSKTEISSSEMGWIQFKYVFLRYSDWLQFVKEAAISKPAINGLSFQIEHVFVVVVVAVAVVGLWLWLWLWL